MASFHVYLPSNTKTGNSTNNFTVDLPETIQLTGDWEVALEEILYPYSWFNLTGENRNNTFRLVTMEPDDKGVLSTRYTTCTIPIRHYAHIEELLSIMNDALQAKAKEANWQSNVEIRYDIVYGRVVFEHGLHDNLLLNDRLAYMLGYKGRNVRLNGYTIRVPELNSIYTFADYPPDVTAGFNTLYVYCSIVAPQIAGNKFVPVLRAVNIHPGRYGATIDREYQNPHYVPVLQKEFNRLEINIKDDTGKLVPFQFGKVLLKVHFRRTRQ